MMRSLAFFAVMLLPFSLCGQAKKGPRTAEQIQKDIDLQKKKLKDLELELAKLNPPKRYKALTFRSLNVGDIGIPGGAFKISEILSEESALVIDDDSPDFPFIARGRSTKNEVEGKLFSFKETPWAVTKTEKLRGRTYYVIEPFVEPKAKD